MRDKTKKGRRLQKYVVIRIMNLNLFHYISTLRRAKIKNGKIIGTLKRQNNSLKNTEKLEWSKDTGTMQM